MVSTGPGRKGSRWRKAQAACMATGQARCLPCYLCGQPIDYEFTRRCPLHRLAGTADHIIGLAQGGDPYDQANLAPVHRGCNTRKSNMIRAGRPVLPRRFVVTSRQW